MKSKAAENKKPVKPSHSVIELEEDDDIEDENPAKRAKIVNSQTSLLTKSPKKNVIETTSKEVPKKRKSKQSSGVILNILK